MDSIWNGKLLHSSMGENSNAECILNIFYSFSSNPKFIIHALFISFFLCFPFAYLQKVQNPANQDNNSNNNKLQHHFHKYVHYNFLINIIRIKDK